MKTLTPAEQDALVRFGPGRAGGFVESLFLKLNLSEGRALWLKTTFLRRSFGQRNEVVEAWAIAFDLAKTEAGAPRHIALKQRWPASEANVASDCLYVRVGPVELRHGIAKGELASEDDRDRITWDLTFTTEPEGFRHLPAAWMYTAGFPRSKAASPQIDCRFSGTITVETAAGAETIRVDDAPGMLGHNWGASHPESWQWAHANAWVGAPGVVFEAVRSTTPIGPLKSPPLTIVHVRLPGERLTLNGPLHMLTNRGHEATPGGELAWRFTGTAGDRRIEATFHAPPERFVGVDYHDPDGRIVHCLNTKIADAELSVYARSARPGAAERWTPVLTATADRSAALEIGTRGDTRGIKILLR